MMVSAAIGATYSVAQTYIVDEATGNHTGIWGYIGNALGGAAANVLGGRPWVQALYMEFCSFAGDYAQHKAEGKEFTTEDWIKDALSLVISATGIGLSNQAGQYFGKPTTLVGKYFGEKIMTEYMKKGFCGTTTSILMEIYKSTNFWLIDNPIKE
jgi:hypothetical protein